MAKKPINVGPAVLCCVVLCPVAIIIFCIIAGVTFSSEVSTTSSTELWQYEQMVVCPKSLRSNYVTYTTTAGAVATLHYSLPPVSDATKLSVTVYEVVSVWCHQNHSTTGLSISLRAAPSTGIWMVFFYFTCMRLRALRIMTTTIMAVPLPTNTTRSVFVSQTTVIL